MGYQNPYLPTGCEESDPRAPWNWPDAEVDVLTCEECGRKVDREHSTNAIMNMELCDRCHVQYAEDCGEWWPEAIAAAQRIGAPVPALYGNEHPQHP